MATNLEEQQIKKRAELKNQIDFTTVLISWLSKNIDNLRIKRKELLDNLKKLK